MAGMTIPQVIVNQTVARLAAQAEVARVLVPDVPSRPVEAEKWTPTPEQFTVQADYLGDEYLSCPACMWEVRIGTDDGPANDLGSLMAAARAHIADKHSGEG